MAVRIFLFFTVYLRVRALPLTSKSFAWRLANLMKVQLSKAYVPSKMSPVIVITFFSPSCLGQETAKGPIGLRVKLQSVYHTRWSLCAVPLIAERQAGRLRILIFKVFGLTEPEIEPRVYRFSSRHCIHLTID